VTGIRYRHECRCGRHERLRHELTPNSPPCARLVLNAGWPRGRPRFLPFPHPQRSLRPVSLRAAGAKGTHSISARRATSSHQSYSSVCGPVPCRPACRRDRSGSRCHLACPFAGRRLVAKNRVVLPRQHPGHSAAVYSPLRRHEESIRLCRQQMSATRVSRQLDAE
jgi:hypothetical protein